MPYMWVEPELVLRYRGVSIYRAYRNDLLDDPYRYHFTTDKTGQEKTFDIRESLYYDEGCSHLDVLRRAIANGEIKAEADAPANMYMGRPLVFSKLMSEADVTEYFQRMGAEDRSLTGIRNYYEKVLGFDPIWRYPISDEKYLGAALIPVQEGFLYLPYDYVDAQEYECYCLDGRSLLDYATVRHMQQTMQDYADGLYSAFSDIAVILASYETPDKLPEE